MVESTFIGGDNNPDLSSRENVAIRDKEKLARRVKEKFARRIQVAKDDIDDEKVQYGKLTEPLV